jgi:uncharacterized protein (DUF433 family)
MVTRQEIRTEARIVEDPEILAGKPVVRGTRIPVALVLDYLAHTPDFRQLFADYPRLTIEDVKACFAFAQTRVEHRARRRRARAVSASSTSA